MNAELHMTDGHHLVRTLLSQSIMVGGRPFSSYRKVRAQPYAWFLLGMLPTLVICLLSSHRRICAPQ
jgi:hypothetical protein